MLTLAGFVTKTKKKTTQENTAQTTKVHLQAEKKLLVWANCKFHAVNFWLPRVIQETYGHPPPPFFTYVQQFWYCIGSQLIVQCKIKVLRWNQLKTTWLLYTEVNINSLLKCM